MGAGSLCSCSLPLSGPSDSSLPAEEDEDEEAEAEPDEPAARRRKKRRSSAAGGPAGWPWLSQGTGAEGRRCLLWAEDQEPEEEPEERPEERPAARPTQPRARARAASNTLTPDDLEEYEQKAGPPAPCTWCAWAARLAEERPRGRRSSTTRRRPLCSTGTPRCACRPLHGSRSVSGRSSAQLSAPPRAQSASQAARLLARHVLFHQREKPDQPIRQTELAALARDENASKGASTGIIAEAQALLLRELGLELKKIELLPGRGNSSGAVPAAACRACCMCLRCLWQG